MRATGVADVWERAEREGFREGFQLGAFVGFIGLLAIATCALVFGWIGAALATVLVMAAIAAGAVFA